MTPAMNRFFVLAMGMLAACYLLPLNTLLLTGRGLPASRLSWLAVGVMFAGAALSTRGLPWRGMRLLYVATLLMCLPALVPHTGLGQDLWQMYCQLSLLVAGVVMTGMLAGMRLPRTDCTDRVVVTGLMVAGAVVTLWTLAAFCLPDLYQRVYNVPTGEGRLAGVMNQANVTGSFLAVTVTLGVWRWLRSGKQYTAYWMAGLATVMAAIHATQSTVALLGVVTGFTLLCLAFGRGEGRALGLMAVVLVAGWMVTTWHPGGDLVPQSNHEYGWRARLQMIRACLALTAERPWTGWGYGTFAGIFPEGLALLGESQMELTVLPHPHNELMYWMTEGGVMAAAGMVLMAAWGLRLMVITFPGKRLSAAALRWGDGWGWCVCVIPVVLHMQTEYPLYQSALHWLVLVTGTGLAMAAWRAQTPVPDMPPVTYTARSRGLMVTCRSTGVLAGVAVVYFTVTACRVDIELSRMEVLQAQYPVMRLFDARDMNPWADHAKALSYQGVRYLMEYKKTQDKRLLPLSIRWLRMSAAYRPDPLVYHHLMVAYRFAGDEAGEAETLREMQRRIRYEPPARTAQPLATQSKTSGVMQADPITSGAGLATETD
jgi:O-antigen polymerase